MKFLNLVGDNCSKPNRKKESEDIQDVYFNKLEDCADQIPYEKSLINIKFRKVT